MAEVLSSIVPALANHLWQSTLFALVAAGLALALRRNHARARYWIWMAASLKFLVPFALLMAVGSHLAKPRPVAVQPTVYVAMENFSEPFLMQQVPIAAQDSKPAATLDWKRRLSGLAGAAWVCGFLCVLGLWCVRWRRIGAAMRESVRIREGREWDALQRIQRAGGVRAHIELVLSRSAMEPGVFGILRPVLAWPKGISERLDDAQLEAILAHEVCHVRRRDNLTAAIHMFVEAAFWFHPLVWWLGARLLEERERACDEEVMHLCAHPEAYAEGILKVCEFCVESPLQCVSGVTGADLKKRVLEIMTQRVAHKLSLGRKLLLLVVGLAVAAVPIVLGQVKGAQRLEALALSAAPKPFRVAAGTLMAEIETPSVGWIASESVAAQDAASTSDAALADAATGPAFEVASIRPTPAKNNGSMGVAVTPSGRVNVMRQSVQSLVYYAYLPHVGTGLVQGGPDWANSQEFDINAKIDDAEAATWGKLSDAQRTDRVRLMIRRLLAERFQLKMHAETQVKPVYALVQTKGGAKLKPVDAPPLNADREAVEAWEKSGNWTEKNVPPGTFLMTGSTWTGKALPISQLLSEIAVNAQVDRLVVDETGLKGSYDFTFKPSHDKDAPALLDQVEDQLGLKLESRKLPVKIYVIDSVEKPSVDGAELGPPASLKPVALAQEKPAQSVPAAPAYVPTMAFDVASVHESKPGAEMHFVGGRFAPHTTNLKLENVDLFWLISLAYGVDYHQISNQPDWSGRTTFTVQAKSDAAADQKMATLDKEKEKLEQQHMVQAFLAERFNLKVHWATQEGDIYNLVLARGGSKLHPAGSLPPPPEERKWLGDTNTPPPIHQQGDGRLGYEFYGHDCPIEDLVKTIGSMMNREVVNKTGLTGNFDFHIQYHGNTPRDNRDEDPTVWPPLTDALEDQLGLKLEAGKGPLRLLVVDHVDKPTEN